MFAYIVKLNQAHPRVFTLVSLALVFLFGILLENTANIKDIDDRALYLLVNLTGYFLALGWLVLLVCYMGRMAGVTEKDETTT